MPIIHRFIPVVLLVSFAWPTLSAQSTTKRDSVAADSAKSARTLPTQVVQARRAAHLDLAPALGKTATPLIDLPASIEVVTRATLDAQGATSLNGAVRNVSGINIGGSSSYGFFDRFLIRGLDARVFTDGFSDGDQSNGFPHSLNGVDHIEVLKGPGSALFGNGPGGGSINVVHRSPSSKAAYSTDFQAGAFGTYSAGLSATGPTSIDGVNYAIDGLVQHADGFRALSSAAYELRPAFGWTNGTHAMQFSVDARYLERTPDSYGIVYYRGTPLSVRPDTRYATPFSDGNQGVGRATFTDTWSVSPVLTITDRASYMHRNVQILRNSGGAVTDTAFTGRQLRQQYDRDDDFNYQFEPVWRFNTGSIAHTLLTGAQLEWQQISDDRATTDLPNITDIFSPVIPELSLSGLNFLRDAKHSGMVDKLGATFGGLYLTDQVDVTSRFKVRVSVRQDLWSEGLTPQVLVPGRLQPNGQLFQPSVTYARHDSPLSWSGGVLYELRSDLSAFAGVSQSALTNFNSEATSQGLAAPETARSYEAGMKIAGGSRLTLTAALFDVTRNNVFTEVSNVVFFNNQETRGGEVDLEVRPTSQWMLLANATVQHAALTSNPSQPTSTGNVPVGVPATILNLWSSYDFAIAGARGFRVGAGVSYNDKTFGNTQNTNSIPASTVVDGVLSYDRHSWGATLGVQNIANVQYYVTALGAGGSVGTPRSVFLKMTYR
jgi:iron complex outermembrane receptor protein